MAEERPRSCRFTTVAKGPAARIEQCACCRTLNVNLGAVSLRLDPSAFESLWSTMGEALLTADADRVGQA